MADGFARDGAEHLGKILDGRELALLETLMEKHAGKSPGRRIRGDQELALLLAPGGAIDNAAKQRTGRTAQPVRAVAFDKTASCNWSLGWHQDRTIAVRRRVHAPGFGPWSVKADIVHVEPPFRYIERMVTVRVHLDMCDAENAPLKIARGSHQLGRIPVDQIAGVVSRSSHAVCLAEPGDVWLYSTAILHASDAAQSPRRRRVLQVDYAEDKLPENLEWLGL